MPDEFGHYIDGAYVDTDSRPRFVSHNPATGAVLGSFPEADEQTVETAVSAARDAFEDWRALSHIQRAEYLWDVFHELRTRTDEFGAIVSEESGKPLNEGVADVIEAAHMVEWAAGDARHPHGDVVPSELPARDAYMRRRPRGVTGCITPWNFPIAIPYWHMAVALVEGNTVVFKPAEQTPRCAQVIAELFDAAGLPPGVFNMVTGGGETGAAIVAHEDVDTLLFTGSATVGHAILEQLGGDTTTRVACEMGGKNSLVITAAADLDIAVPAAIMSAFKTTGQRCVSAERLFVHTDVVEAFTDRFVETAEALQIGDPLDAASFMGPLIDAAAVEKVRGYNDLAREEGVEVLVDRSEPTGLGDGHWVGPFVYRADPEAPLRCTHEEVFGPHVAILPYDGGIEQAVAYQNDTEFGLAGAIISDDFREVNYYRDHADVGLAYANLPCIGAEVQLPFGGVRRSGNGYPSAREIIEAVTDRVAWTINNSTEIALAQGLSADIQTE
jgi:NAD-dependent aldehyde dehydrogenases